MCLIDNGAWNLEDQIGFFSIGATTTLCLTMRFINKAISTSDCLRRHHFNVSNECVFCHSGDKTMDHIFRTCLMLIWMLLIWLGSLLLLINCGKLETIHMIKSNMSFYMNRLNWQKSDFPRNAIICWIVNTNSTRVINFSVFIRRQQVFAATKRTVKGNSSFLQILLMLREVCSKVAIHIQEAVYFVLPTRHMAMYHEQIKD